MIKYGHPPRGDAGFSLRLSIFWIFFMQFGGYMKKWLKITIIVLSITLIIFIGYFLIQKYLRYKEEERIRNAIIKVDLVSNLNIEFNSEIYISDLIESINGTILDNRLINTEKLGLQEINFKYINEENIKVPYKFNVNIVDSIPPVVWLNNTYTIKVGYNKKLEDAIMCADNYDDELLCEIIGNYDVNKIGNYDLTYHAMDSSGNETNQPFTLKVVKSTSSSSSTKKIAFSSIKEKYSTSNAKVGLDVSKWQGTIDFEKVKEAGVDFVYIKLGGQNGIGKDYYLDPKFETNIEGFKKVGIPVGLYYYSYSNSIEQAKKDALWVLEQIKDYEIDLPIAYDWENWSSYNKFHMSFYNLTKTADMFMDTISKNGYETMLYSSKNYLEKIWLNTSHDIWLAHYTDKTNYEGKYRCWQMTSSATIPGIKDNTVDVDICY